MAKHGLIDTIEAIPSCFSPEANTLRFPDGHLTPGSLVVLTAFANSKHVPRGNVLLPKSIQGYASAIGLSKALWGVDDYEHERWQQGKNYSTLEHLNNSHAADHATSRINSCIRAFVADQLPTEFVAKLSEVVGDLHDNVWSHGMASGFSMAQKCKIAWTLGRDHSLEFALADCGLGFLREMQRVGMNVGSHRDAIDWCIQEGHSTKKLRPASEWAQRLPEDAIGNPLRGIEQTRVSDNHHMGLGLYKLTQFVKGFRGQLWLASGDAVLVLEPDREETYHILKEPWQGVAMACRFRTSEIKRARGKIEAGDNDVERLMEILGGRRG